MVVENIALQRPGGPSDRAAIFEGAALVAVASKLRQHVTPDDDVVQIGADEGFVALYCLALGVRSLTVVAPFAEQMHKTFAMNGRELVLSEQAPEAATVVYRAAEGVIEIRGEKRRLFGA